MQEDGYIDIFSKMINSETKLKIIVREYTPEEKYR